MIEALVMLGSMLWHLGVSLFVLVQVLRWLSQERPD